jgi:tetratricopeptide (TPR) repeat protein
MISGRAKIITEWILLAMILSLGVTSAFAQTAAQQSPRATITTTSPRCSQAVKYYELNPESPITAGRLLDCYKALQMPEGAAAVFRRMAEKPGTPLLAWKLAAQAYTAANLLFEAESAYLKYVQSKPGDIEARLSLAGLYNLRSAYDQAAEQYRAVVTLQPKYSPALAGLARTLFWQGHPEESLQMFNRAVAANPKDAEAAAGKAYALFWMGRAEEARTLFSDLHTKFPKDSSIANGLQQTQAAVQQKAVAEAIRTGDTATLEAQYRQQLERNPRDLGVLRTLSELTAKPERCAENLGYRRTAADVAPADTTVGIELARTLATCGQLADAIAEYRRVLQASPENQEALYGLGNGLRLAGQLPESIEVLRKAVRLNPRDADALVALARALVSDGNDDEALADYSLVLNIQPENYEALQGKAYVLFWTKKYGESRAIFQELAKKQPGDKQNAQALEQIASAEEEARWAAMRPGANDGPEAWLSYYEKRIAAYPNDIAAIKGRAYTLDQLKRYPEAIQAYQRVLQAFPDDRGSKIELARLLSWEGRLDESINIYRELQKETPADTELLENLSRVYLWSNRPQEALETYQKLLAQNPSNTGYQLQLAQLQLQLKDTPAAREFLTAVLAADPKNREAALLLGQMNLTQGHWDAAVQDFDQILKRNPKDTGALFGKARAYYFQGDVNHSYPVASQLIREQPENVDALFLMANLERARRNRAGALALLDRTLTISPDHAEAKALRKSIREAGVITLQTSASYLRETGSAASVSGQPQLQNEDLRSYNYGSTLGFAVLPKTDSYFSANLQPSSTPFGDLHGTAGPSLFFYRQNSQVTPRLKLRAGVGLVRFGPGEPVSLPGQPEPVRVTSFRPLALAGLSYEVTKALTVDANWNRTAIDYTPTATRFGIIENQESASASYSFSRRTHLRLEYYYGRFSTGRFDHVTFVDGQRIVNRTSDHDQVHSGTAEFTVNVFRSSRVSFDAGYSGVLTGDPGPAIFLGFYNPSFNQTHLFTTHFFGKLWGPLSYDFFGGVGLQQPEDFDPRRAVQVSPSFRLRVNRHLSLNFGYAYYNTAQALSTLGGQSFFLNTNWTF